MVREAKVIHQDDGPEPEKPRLDGVLRLLEAVVFCCLSALAVFWFYDRLRDLDFDPITVMPCVDEACSAYVGPTSDDLVSAFTGAIEARGVTSFSRVNICTQLAETLQTRGERAEGMEQVLALLSGRGTVDISRPEAGTVTIRPGHRNNSFADALRDAIRLGPARGCHPINYKPVFWPLWCSWMLLTGLRLFRSRQAEWAKR